MAYTFSARFPGECHQCFEPFEEGDEIGYVDDQICCEICCDMACD